MNELALRSLWFEFFTVWNLDLGRVWALPSRQKKLGPFIISIHATIQRKKGYERKKKTRGPWLYLSWWIFLLSTNFLVLVRLVQMLGVLYKYVPGSSWEPIKYWQETLGARDNCAGAFSIRLKGKETALFVYSRFFRVVLFAEGNISKVTAGWCLCTFAQTIVSPTGWKRAVSEVTSLINTIHQEKKINPSFKQQRRPAADFGGKIRLAEWRAWTNKNL